jgi:hypothetical protein
MIQNKRRFTLFDHEIYDAFWARPLANLTVCFAGSRTCFFIINYYFFVRLQPDFFATSVGKKKYPTVIFLGGT